MCLELFDEENVQSPRFPYHTKNKLSSPNHDAEMKSVNLALREISRIPVCNCVIILNQFLTLLENRVKYNNSNSTS